MALRLADATSPEIRALLARMPRAWALLPVGAVEAHGPHLPLATDVVIAEGLARRLGEALEARGDACVIAPALAYSHAVYAGEFPGTAGLPADVAGAHVTAVIQALAAAGFVRVAIVNAHLEPAHLTVLRDAAARAKAAGVDVVCPAPTPKTLREAYAARWGRTVSHAGSYETSLVLAEAPALVREDVRRALADNPNDLVAGMARGAKTFAEAGGPEAYFDSPRAASREEGEWTYAALVAELLRALA